MCLDFLVDISLKYELEFLDYSRWQKNNIMKIYSSDNFYFANKDKLEKLVADRSTIEDYREKAEQEMLKICGDQELVENVLNELNIHCYREYEQFGDFFGSKRRRIINTHSRLKDILSKK